MRPSNGWRNSFIFNIIFSLDSRLGASKAGRDETTAIVHSHRFRPERADSPPTCVTKLITWPVKSARKQHAPLSHRARREPKITSARYGARLVKEALAAPQLVPAGSVSGYRVAMAVRRQNSNKQHAARFAPPRVSPGHAAPSIRSLWSLHATRRRRPARTTRWARGTSDRTRDKTPTASANSALPSVTPSFLSPVPRRAVFLSVDTPAIL